MSLKKGSKGHASFYAALRLHLLGFIKRCIDSGRHHVLPNLLLFLLLLLLTRSFSARRRLDRVLRGRIAAGELRAA